MSSAGQYARYRAPEEDRQVLSVPPWQAVGDLVVANQSHRASHSTQVQGLSLHELSKAARKEILALALAYTQTYSDPKLPVADSPLIMTGHQPDLVHPGVWLKDFAAGRIASRVQGTAVSLVIDSDLCRSRSIRVPTGNLTQPRVESVAYDKSSQPVPLEETSIADSTTWNSFGSRTAKAISPFITSPLIAEWWPQYACSQASENLGLSIAQARHRLEMSWGNQSLNLPQSQICQTNSFRQFAVHLLANAETFRSAYNSTLSEYRAAHRLRNHAQPTPNLSKAEGLYETPFWIWSTDNPQRRGLFVQKKSKEILLTDKATFSKVLPLATNSEAMPAIEQLAEWESQGIKIRTRALATTMYARLVLADLFIHGIGGAKYDQVTDAICERFFGFAPAAYLTLSATLRLPIAHPASSLSEKQRLQQKLRQFAYHPENELAKLTLDNKKQATVDKILAQKRFWVQTLKTPSNASERHQGIVSANLAMQPWLAARRSELEKDLVTASQRLRANLVLESREYPFCLFPHEHLRKFFLDF